MSIPPTPNAALAPTPPASPAPLRAAFRLPSRHGASVLAWPAWRRVAAVVPALGLLWLAVVWALSDVAPL